MFLKNILSGLGRLSAALALASLAACGGGGGAEGGAGPGGGNDGFRVSVQTSLLAFDADEGAVLATKTIYGTAVGTPAGTIYTGAIDEGTAIDQVTIDGDAKDFTFTVHPKQNLPAGQYQGSIKLFACTDDKCARQVPGSPAKVDYTITVRPTLKITSASTIRLKSVSGATASSEITLQLPAGETSFSVDSTDPWASVSNIGNGKFTVTAQPMPPGSYTALVGVKSAKKSVAVIVYYDVTKGPDTVMELHADVASATFTALAGYPAAGSRNVNITLPSWTTELSASIVYSGASGWLSLEKTGPLSYALKASAATLAPGNYNAALVIKSGVHIEPLSLPINIAVDRLVWSVSGVPTFDVRQSTAAAALTADIGIDLVGLPAQGWTASTSTPWLQLVNTSGTTGSTPLRVRVDLDQLASLDNFATHVARIEIASPSNVIAPQTVQLNLQKQVAQIEYLSPRTRLPGEGGDLIVRGRGFDTVPDLQQALGVGGGSVTGIQRVSDSELVLQVPGAAAGVTTFQLNNALGLAPRQAALLRVAQGSFAYRAIATQGDKAGLFFDAERQSLYTANKTLGTLMRFAYSNGDWNVSDVSVPGIDMAAMAPDGKSVVVTSKAGKIVLIDPATLAVQASYPALSVAGDASNARARLAVTNNGKAFFQGSAQDVVGIPYFDLITRRFGGVATAQNINYFDGPWFSVSGDGERLLIVQSGAVTSPMLAMDAATERPAENPVGITHWIAGTQSLHGERFVEENYRVWDRDFNLIGNVVLPDQNYGARVSVFAPDGNRLYVMSYPNSAWNQALGLPRVYVFDSSTRSPVNTDLPVLGYFDLNDLPTCATRDDVCQLFVQGAIAPDGKTLFFAGTANLIVAPIPALIPVAARGPMQRAKPGSFDLPRKTTPLRLKR